MTAPSDKDDELKPCPCCGGKASIGNSEPDGSGGYFVECDDCGVTTPLIHNMMGTVRRELLDKWNRRVVRPETGKRTGKCGAWAEGLIERKYCDLEFGHPGPHSYQRAPAEAASAGDTPRPARPVMSDGNLSGWSVYVTSLERYTDQLEQLYGAACLQLQARGDKTVALSASGSLPADEVIRALRELADGYFRDPLGNKFELSALGRTRREAIIAQALASRSTSGLLPDWMVIGAVRYAIGRQSYQVGVTCRWLVENWERIPQTAKDVIRRDLEEAKARDDKHRLHGSSDPVDRGPYFLLGQDMDRREWLAVLALAQASTVSATQERSDG